MEKISTGYQDTLKQLLMSGEVEKLLNEIKHQRKRIPKGYVSVSATYINELKGYDIQIIYHIARNEDESGWTDVKCSKIASLLNCSEITIRRNLKHLKERGLVIQKESNSTKYRVADGLIKQEFYDERETADIIKILEKQT